MTNNITITKIFGWEMAHMLANYKGACQNLHGHSYRLQVTVMRIAEPTLNDMVVDFSDLRALVNKLIVYKYDHAFLYWKNSNDEGEQAIAAAVIKSGLKAVGMKQRPTAENMVSEIADSLHKPLEKLGLTLRNIKLWETSSSYAEVSFYD